METTPTPPIGIVGAGAWGTALAICLSAGSRDIVLWGRNRQARDLLDRTRRHPSLPRSELADTIRCTADMAEIADLPVVIMAVPAQAVRGMADLHPLFADFCGSLILAAKGLERATGQTMPDVAAETWPNARIAILSGPTFATELSCGLPGAATIAASSLDHAADLAAMFEGGPLRIYASDDLTGVALGGAVKNVLAIAAGAVMGAGLGSNARAGLIARGLAEMTRLGAAAGARPETMAGLSGLGDVVLSCTDDQSRNYCLGFALGSGQPRPAGLTEGAHTVRPLLDLASRHGVDLPIAATVDAVLNDGMPLKTAVSALMNRPSARE